MPPLNDEDLTRITQIRVSLHPTEVTVWGLGDKNGVCFIDGPIHLKLTTKLSTALREVADQLGRLGR
ncbi:hypothetical protein EBR66_01485 [bacterium]|nr:hypothetical protein [bacterium]